MDIKKYKSIIIYLVTLRMLWTNLEGFSKFISSVTKFHKYI